LQPDGEDPAVVGGGGVERRRRDVPTGGLTVGQHGGMDADDVIRVLELEPHPEGGWYRQTWRNDPGDGSRGAGTAIYYLLQAGERSHWHRVDADEVWHFYGGTPLRLRMWPGDGSPDDAVLGNDLAAGERPQIRVPAGVWQSAEPTGAWTLVGCTVSPAFEFDGFELAPPGWRPPT
jgi:predicted cupin superfamily sugar epimerase